MLQGGGGGGRRLGLTFIVGMGVTDTNDDV